MKYITRRVLMMALIAVLAAGSAFAAFSFEINGSSQGLILDTMSGENDPVENMDLSAAVDARLSFGGGLSSFYLDAGYLLDADGTMGKLENMQHRLTGGLGWRIDGKLSEAVGIYLSLGLGFTYDFGTEACIFNAGAGTGLRFHVTKNIYLSLGADWKGDFYYTRDNRETGFRESKEFFHQRLMLPVCGVGIAF